MPFYGKMLVPNLINILGRQMHWRTYITLSKGNMLNTNKIGKVYDLEYTDIPKALFTPQSP
jgi:hypothetical protein